MGQPTVQQRFALCTFCNDIDKDSVTRTFDVFADLTQQGFTTIHVLFKSNGGHTPEGIALHNYFKTFPMIYIFTTLEASPPLPSLPSPAPNIGMRAPMLPFYFTKQPEWLTPLRMPLNT
jgi:hypothetical protein